MHFAWSDAGDGWPRCEHGTHEDDCLICSFAWDTLTEDDGSVPSSDPGTEDITAPHRDGDDNPSTHQVRQDQDVTTCQTPKHPTDGDARPVIPCTHAHDAPMFGCQLCSFSSRHHGNLLRHREAAHRGTKFVENFASGCACGTLFSSRLAATKHANCCVPADGLTSTAAPTPASASTLATTTDTGKRRRLTPSHDLQDEDALMLPVDAGTLRRAQQPPRRTTTRWHRKPEVETVPDTPTDGWVVVGRSSTRWGPRLTKAPALVEPVGRPTCWEPLRLDDEPIPDTPSDGWVTVSTAVAAPESPKAPRTDHARTCALEPTVPPMITWQQLLPAVTSFAASPTPTLPRTSSNSSRNTPRELQTQDASFAASPPSRSPPLSTWLLRFDGAAKRSKTKGTQAGAGAVLTDPTNSVTWTCSIHLPDPTETNNSAEYYGLLAGLKGATTHGVNCLEIEGDSTLVVRQVLGQFATNNIRLRGLRDEVRQLLQSFESYTLKHIDRRLNQHADRLANLAVKQKRTSIACSQHDKADPCCNQWLRPQADRRDTSPAQQVCTQDTGPDDMEVDEAVADGDADSARDDEMPGVDDSVVHDRARLDGNNAFHIPLLRQGAAPAKLRPLRLRHLTDEDWDAARDVVQSMAADLTSLIRDAPDWSCSERYISAIPYRLRDVLAPYCTQPGRTSTSTRRTRSTGDAVAEELENRVNDARNAVHNLQRQPNTPPKELRRARRRVGRLRSAQARRDLRRRFRQRERDCVEAILQAAKDKTTKVPAPPVNGRCPISSTDLHSFFVGSTAPRQTFDYYDPTGAPFRTIIENYTAATEDKEALTDDITTDEIEDILQHVSPSSSPGLDGVGYAVYRSFSYQLLPLLHTAFASCWKHHKVPALWKVGAVRLLHKKGDRMRPENWRPICLQSALYKLYSGILTRRFTRWLERNNRLPASQKGFRRMNGCHEHGFIATSLLDQGRRMHKRAYIAWYDLANAFGSIPQELLWRVLAGMKVPANFLQLLQDIYHDSFFVITNPADADSTDPIRQELGVYQGCPMSPYLFLAAVAPLLEALEAVPDAGVSLAPGISATCTAYADDLKTFSQTAKGIRELHAVVARFLKWTTLRANPSKCALLQPPPPPRATTTHRPVKLTLQGDEIPTVDERAGYRYLGVSDGMTHSQHQVQLDDKLLALRMDVDALVNSGLAPGQIVKAIKTYIYPKIDYVLRHVRPPKAQLEAFDKSLVKRIKHLLRLPRSATALFIFAPTSAGGLGFLPLVDLHAALQLSHAFQMFHSPDAIVRAVARSQVMQAVRKRFHLDEDYWKDREDDAVMQFLNGTLDASPFATNRRSHADIGSLWTDVQQTLRLHNLRFDSAPNPLDDDKNLQLRVPHHDDWLSTKTVLRRVKLHVKLGYFARWKALKDQGRTTRVHGGVGSAFMAAHSNVADADYRFALRARLNQTETRATLKRMRIRSNDTCRHHQCNDKETLAHVVGHCMGNDEAIRGRHDRVLAVIADTIRKRHHSRAAADHVEVLIDSFVPNLAGRQLKPDVQILNHATKTATIVDLAITFEDQREEGTDKSTLAATQQLKINKYGQLTQHFRRLGWTARFGAIVYGALGSVLPSNFDTYTKLLGTTKRDATRLNKRLSVEAIRGSKRIWLQHTGQHRQRVRKQNQSHAGTSRRNYNHNQRSEQSPDALAEVDGTTRP